MACLRFYVISCSSDSVRLDARSLYVWGEMGAAKWLPDSEREAKRRISQCKIHTRCKDCDAEIHRVAIQRRSPTINQTE
jgi:hypothetical protein